MLELGKTIKVRATYIEDVLGSGSANPKIHSEFIASKAPDAPSMKEEVEAIGVEAMEEKQKTVFSKDDNGNPFLWDYQIKGFFKGTCGFLRSIEGTSSSKIKNYKKKLDGLLFIEPRRVALKMPEGSQIGDCQRSLRAQTMQGDRVALANSESCAAGTEMEFTVRILDEGLEKFVREALDYGEYSGIGQWRNSGKGRFVWAEVK